MTLRIAGLAVVVLVLAAGCRQPLSPGMAETALLVKGPSTIVPGATATLTASFYDKDNNKSDVTDKATWTSEQPEIAEVTGGVVTARSRGEVVIEVTYGGQSTSTTLLILEPNTFKAPGRVLDYLTSNGIGGATIEVVKGAGIGLKTTSSATGAFTLYGVNNGSKLLVSADHYQPISVDATFGGTFGATVKLIPDGAGGPLTGDWVLTFNSSECRMPSLGTGPRQFLAKVSQTGKKLVVVPWSPTIYYASTLVGTVEGDTFQFPLPFYYDTGEGATYALLDRLQPKGYVGIRGTVRGTIQGNEWKGRLEGAMDYYAVNLVEAYEECPGVADRKSEHQLVIDVTLRRN
jgi:hypothetical protein